jgi:DNA-binding IscR family transcriptional regulator
MIPPIKAIKKFIGKQIPLKTGQQLIMTCLLVLSKNPLSKLFLLPFISLRETVNETYINKLIGKFYKTGLR